MSTPPRRKKQPRRRPGRPKRGQEIITPAVLERIAELWLEGVSPRKIGEAVGADRMSVLHHLERSIRPLWHEQMRSMLDVDLAKVALLEKVAWERFHAKAPAESIEQIEKTLTAGKSGRSRLKITKQAVRSITRTGDSAWLQVIQWCLDFRARIHGHYAPTRSHVDIGGDLRVAGKSPSEVDEEMLDRLLTQIQERRIRQIARKSD